MLTIVATLQTIAVSLEWKCSRASRLEAIASLDQKYRCSHHQMFQSFPRQKSVGPKSQEESAHNSLFRRELMPYALSHGCRRKLTFWSETVSINVQIGGEVCKCNGSLRPGAAMAACASTCDQERRETMRN